MRFFQSLLAILFSIVLTACGGGGGSSAPAATYSISGTVTGAASVSVTLSGASSATATTDGSGNYSFTGLANGSYTVTPNKTGYAFNPVSTAVTLSGANSTGNNFTATVAATTYSISGTVSGASGVTVTLGGASTGSVVTGAGGTYSFSGLPAGNYTLTPTLSGYTFAPTSIAITALAANSTGNNFTATAIPVAHSISGNVSGTTGVTITVTGTANATATTDGSGNYTVSGLFDGSYTLTPSKTGYTFTPTSTPVTLAGANVTGTNFTGVANAAVTATASGTITGPWVEGVTVTLSGGASGSTTTNASGNYSFANLPSGQSYTFTPSLPGYTYTAASQTVSVAAGSSAAVTVPAMAGASTVAASSVSGTLTYAGSKTGTIFVRLLDSACTSNCATLGQTSVANQGGAFTAVPFTIRGVTPGNYLIRSYIDTQNNGAGNSSNPGVIGTAFTVTAGSNVTGQALTINDVTPPTSFTLAAPTVFPGDQSALVNATLPVDALGREKATSYKIYWGTDAAASTGGGSRTFAALGKDNNFFFVGGLTNGATYFKIAALVGATEYPASTVAGPITIGAGSGGNTLSGTVTFPGTATGPLVVLAFSQTSGVYFTRIASPTSPQSYSIAGIPNGSYTHVALIDNDNSGRVNAGDPNNTNGVAPTVVLSGTGATSNLTLTSASAAGVVRVNYYNDGVNPANYSLNVGTTDGLKRVVRSVLYSGSSIAVPVDIEVRDGWTTWKSLNGATPVAGDQYKYRVTYSDGTTGDLTATVTAPLAAAGLAQNLTFAAGTLSWTAPATAPASYGYWVGVQDLAYANLWSYPQNDMLPSGTTSATYTGPALTTGVTYRMQVMMRDFTTGNSTTRSTTFVAP